MARGSTHVLHRNEWMLFLALSAILLMYKSITADSSDKNASNYDRKPEVIQYNQYSNKNYHSLELNEFRSISGSFRLQDVTLSDYCDADSRALCYQKRLGLGAPCGAFHHGTDHDPAFSSFMDEYLHQPNRCEFSFWTKDELPEAGNDHEFDKMKIAFRIFLQNFLEKLYVFSKEHNWIILSDHEESHMQVEVSQPTADLFTSVMMSVATFMGSIDALNQALHEERRLSVTLHHFEGDRDPQQPIEGNNRRIIHLTGHHRWTWDEVWDMALSVIDNVAASAHRSASSKIEDFLADDSTLEFPNEEEFKYGFAGKFTDALRSQARQEQARDPPNVMTTRWPQDPKDLPKLQHNYPQVVPTPSVNSCLWSYYETKELLEPRCGYALEHAAVRSQQLAEGRMDTSFQHQNTDFHQSHDWYLRLSMAVAICSILIVGGVHYYQAYVVSATGGIHMQEAEVPKMLGFSTLQVRRALLFHLLVTLCWWTASAFQQGSISADTLLSSHVYTGLFLNASIVTLVALTMTYVIARSTDAAAVAEDTQVRPTAWGYELATMDVDEEL